jgi:hypothetical protein
MDRLEGQGKHLIVLLILLVPIVGYARLTGVLEGEWLGLSARSWYWIAVGIPIVHQFGTMFLWRAELHGKALTRVFGDRAFVVFMAFFCPGLISRPISVLALALADRGTAEVATWILNVIALIMLPILLYLFYSIVRYFGIQRAAGADHFLEEYRRKPIVVEGIFRYIPNAMYVIGFFTVWIPALLYASEAAVIVTGFQHALIWAHYFFTEVPDMQMIYGGDKVR